MFFKPLFPSLSLIGATVEHSIDREELIRSLDRYIVLGSDLHLRCIRGECAVRAFFVPFSCKKLVSSRGAPETFFLDFGVPQEGPGFLRKGPGGQFRPKSRPCAVFGSRFWAFVLRVAVFIVFPSKIDEQTMKNRRFFEVVFVRRALEKTLSFCMPSPRGARPLPRLFSILRPS